MLKGQRLLYPMLCALLMHALIPASALAEMSDSANWAATLARSYRITPNVTYLTANNWEGETSRLSTHQLERACSNSDLHPWRRLDRR